MYTLVSSLCLTNSIGAQWETPNLSNVFIYSAFITYKKFYLILSHPSTSDPIYVDMNSLRQNASGFLGTVKQWLVSLGNFSLPTVPTIPNKNIKYAKFANAVQAGYTINIAASGLNYKINYPKSAMPDLKLTRDQFETNMSLLETHCLTTVNGFIHDCKVNKKEAFIINGATTGRMSDSNHVGIYSFVDIGKLTKIRLDPLNIVPMEKNSTLMEKICFTVKADLTNKSYFLVLGGYLVLPQENLFFQTGENTFSLNLNKLPYVERLLESYTLLDLTDLGLIPPNIDPNGFDINAVRSDAVIKKYMTLSQSFLVVVDTEQLFIDKKVIMRAAFPGQFICHDDPVYPVIGGHGKFFEFWKQQERGKWSVNTRDTYYRRFIFTEKDTPTINYASAALDATKIYDHSQAFLLEISSVNN